MRTVLGLVVLSVLAAASVIAHHNASPNDAPAAPTLPPSSAAEASHASALAVTRDQPHRTAGFADLVVELQMKRKLSQEAFLAALAAIAQRQPELAIELAMACGHSDESGPWVSSIMQDWSRRDPRKSWQWIAQQRDRLDELADGSLPAIALASMAATDRKLLLDTVDALLNKGETTGPFATQLAAQLGLDALVKSGQTELAQQTLDRWLNSPSKPDIGASAYETVAAAIAAAAPAEAARWLMSLPASDTRTEAITNFAGEWSTKDPRAALTWAQGLSADDGQPAAVQRSFIEWAERSPAEASDWLDQHLQHVADKATADPLIEGMINLRDAAIADPQAALPWARRLVEPAARSEMESRLVLRWSRVDMDAAMDYVWRSSTILPERKQLLLQEMKRPLPATDGE